MATSDGAIKISVKHTFIHVSEESAEPVLASRVCSADARLQGCNSVDEKDAACRDVSADSAEANDVVALCNDIQTRPETLQEDSYMTTNTHTDNSKVSSPKVVVRKTFIHVIQENEPMLTAASRISSGPSTWSYLQSSPNPGEQQSICHEDKISPLGENHTLYNSAAGQSESTKAQFAIDEATSNVSASGLGRGRKTESSLPCLLGRMSALSERTSGKVLPAAAATAEASKPKPVADLASAVPCTGTMTCHMSFRDRTKRCDKKFSRNGSAFVHGRELPFKFFVTAVPVKSSKRRDTDITFRSPNARLKLEVRCDDQEFSSKPLEGDLGCAHLHFSVTVASRTSTDNAADFDQVQRAQHLHDFSRCASFECPETFVPPDTDATWIVQVTLTSVDDNSAHGV